MAEIYLYPSRGIPLPTTPPSYFGTDQLNRSSIYNGNVSVDAAAPVTSANTSPHSLSSLGSHQTEITFPSDTPGSYPDACDHAIPTGLGGSVHRQHGPTLLPKLRSQDLVAEPVAPIHTRGPLTAPSGPTSAVDAGRDVSCSRRSGSSTRKRHGYTPYPVRPSVDNVAPLRSTNPPSSSEGDCLISPAGHGSSALGLGLAFGPSPSTSMLSARVGSALPAPVCTAIAAGNVQIVAPAPVSAPSTRSHGRTTTSSSNIDEAMLARYSYPTYSQIPRYVTQPSPAPLTAPVLYSPFSPYSAVPSPTTGIETIIPVQKQGMIYPQDQKTVSVTPTAPTAPPSPVVSPSAGLVPPPPSSAFDLTSPSTSLIDYLMAPTQQINLVQHISYPIGRGQQNHFWWDIRNLRAWSSFSLETIDQIPGLTRLLTTSIPAPTATGTVPAARLSPARESDLSDLIRDIYAPRVNAALRLSLGPDCIALYQAPDAQVNISRHRNTAGGAHFLANYANDIERTAGGGGIRRSRVVGLIKSFDRWNSGMRNEAPHKRVGYLAGLAHLQKCMRDHGCRYGFVMTEIELVCVRAGVDEQDRPYFGYLELAAPIATKVSVESINTGGISPNLRSHSVHSAQTYDRSEGQSSPSPTYPSPELAPPSPSTAATQTLMSSPMTATLALYYLLMLAKATPLPTQQPAQINLHSFPITSLVTSPDGSTERHTTVHLPRNHVLPPGSKDPWIPEPQTSEKRDARRVRGWIFPADPYNRREDGGRRARRGRAAWMRV